MWSLIVVQLWTYAAAVNWLFTATDVIRERMMMARPRTKSAIMLGSVALFTAFAGMLLNLPKVKEKYSRR